MLKTLLSFIYLIASSLNKVEGGQTRPGVSCQHSHTTRARYPKNWSFELDTPVARVHLAQSAGVIQTICGLLPKDTIHRLLSTRSSSRLTLKAQAQLIPSDLQPERSTRHIAHPFGFTTRTIYSPYRSAHPFGFTTRTIYSPYQEHLSSIPATVIIPNWSSSLDLHGNDHVQ